MAVATGIAPTELIKTPTMVFQEMVKLLQERAADG
jgi:hypothetical protein